MVPAAVPTSTTALEGKRLLVILGSYRSKRHLYAHARALGVRLVLVDGPGHWSKDYVGPAELFERVLEVDLAPFETFAARAVGAARATGLTFDGIGTIEEFAGGFTARVAKDLQLPFHSIAAADTARDKHAAREACGRGGLPGPQVARIQSVADLSEAGSHVGFPAVLKPVSGVGSVQTYRVNNEDDLLRRFQQVTADVEVAERDRHEKINSDRHWFDLMWSGPPHMTLESWIEGQKYDVDLLFRGGEVLYAHATDDLDPCGLRDVRRVAPSGLSVPDETSLIEHAARCVRAIGFETGVFNVEVKLTRDGPRMIEVNGRLGGYSTTDVHRAVWGVDLIEQWLRLSFGLPATIVPASPTMWVAESLLPCPRTGVVQRDGFLDGLNEQPDVVVARPWTFRGDRVAGVETNAPDWLGAVVARGDTRDEALANLDRVVASIVWPV